MAINSSSLQPQMQVQTLPCKGEAVFNPDLEMLPPSVDLSSLKMDWGEVENSPVVWRLHMLESCLEIMDAVSSRWKTRETIWLVTSA